MKLKKELAKKLFLLEEYCNNKNMEEHIKEYINKLKNDYPKAEITKEYYNNSILIKAILKN